MEIRESIINLDSTAWPLLGRLASSTETCFLDISQLRRVTPDGVVALLLMTRGRRGKNTILNMPEKRDHIYNHLIRIDLVYLMRLWGFVRFERVQKYDKAPAVRSGTKFSKTLISISDEHESAIGLVCDYIDRAYPNNATTLKTVFTELLNNLRDHSSHTDDAPFYCTQIEARKDGLHISFGDLGVGFQASLARNPMLSPFPSQAHALRAAVVEAASGLGHLNPDRGGGLQRALAAVADLGGHYRVRSYDGGVHLRDGAPAFGTTPHSFPGTLTGISLP